MVASLLAAVVTLAPAAPLPREVAARPDWSAACGQWIVTDRIQAGVRETDELWQNARAEITATTLKIWLDPDGKPLLVLLTRDTTAAPAAVELHDDPSFGEKDCDTALAIWKLEGDVLTICFGTDEQRPTQFSSTARSGTDLFVFKRVKR